jgi:histidinol-phosphate/aromatic aminotransferase/cobyric acid decarboxylase-like protein
MFNNERSHDVMLTHKQIAKLDANENLHPVPEELMQAVTE